LHIFFFNLVCGGTVLLYFTQARQKISWQVLIFLIGSLSFSIAALFNLYLTASIICLILTFVVENVRVGKFSLFPIEFFKKSVPLSDKFHQAALLCLSLALLICAGVMINTQYLHLINNTYLILDDFFLGFSFPISLVTFAVIFSMTRDTHRPLLPILGVASFWIVTVGVVIFFVLIILAIWIAELITSIVLLLDVLLLYYLFRVGSLGRAGDRRFLTSGMVFLITTGITGVLLALWSVLAPQDLQGRVYLLQTHAYLSLYGWNLVGLTAIIHFVDFPKRLDQTPIILLHWITVVLLAPLGSVYPLLAIIAIALFVFLTRALLLSQPDPAVE
jgi:hypothetical protein